MKNEKKIDHVVPRVEEVRVGVEWIWGLIRRHCLNLKFDISND